MSAEFGEYLVKLHRTVGAFFALELKVGEAYWLVKDGQVSVV